MAWNKGLKGEEYLSHYKNGKTHIMILNENKPPFLGKHHTPERNQKVREFMINWRKNHPEHLIGNKFRLGIPHTEEDKIKISIGFKKYYDKHPEKFKMTEEHKKNLSKTKIRYYKEHPEAKEKCFPFTKKERSERAKKQWEDINFVLKVKKSLNFKPSKPEKYLIKLFRKFNIPFVYVGNWKKFINGKNPDFINFEQKKIIEFNGFYTHTKEEEIEREKHFKKEGYETLFLHYFDLKNPTQLIEKVNKFLEVLECE